MKQRWTRLLRRIDGYQQQHRWLGFPYAVMRKFGEDQAGNLAALIAYYAFFSFFPLLLVFVTVLGFVLQGHPGLEQRVTGSVLDQFPIIGGQLGRQSHGLTGNGFGLAVGLVGTLWGGLGVANTAQTALNSVWEVSMADRPNMIKRSGRSLLLLLVVGVGALATTAISGLSSGAASFGLPGFGPVLRVLAALLALVLNVGLFTLAFRVLTVRDIDTRDVLPGAVIAAVFWQALQLVGGYYVAHQLKGASQTYGTFAVVIGLLSWFYLQAQLTLLAAEVNTVLKLRLWPRGLVDAPQTEADGRAYEAYAETERYQQPEKVDVRFEGRGDQPARKDQRTRRG